MDGSLSVVEPGEQPLGWLAGPEGSRIAPQGVRTIIPC